MICLADKLTCRLKAYRVYLALASLRVRVKRFCEPCAGNWVTQDLGRHVY